MILFPTKRNRQMLAALDGLPRHKGINAAADAAVNMITADPNWEADFAAAISAAAPAAAPAANPTTTLPTLE